MKTKEKIKYGPNVIFITGPVEAAEMHIFNASKTNKDATGPLKGNAEHCQKCKERILSILN